MALYKLKCLEVGSSVDLVTHMDQMWKDAREQPRVKGFPFEEVIAEGKGVLTSISAMDKEAESYRSPCNVDKARGRVERLRSRAETVLVRVKKYHASILPVWQGLRKQHAARKKNWKNHRDTISRKLRESNIAPAVAKRAADLVYSSTDDPGKCGIAVGLETVPEFQLEDDCQKEVYTKPAIISSVAQLPKELAATHLHTACAKLIEGCAETVAARVVTIRGAMIEESVKSGFSTASLPEGAPSIVEASHPARKEWFKPVVQTKLIVYAQEEGSCDMAREACPLSRGIRQILTVFSGSLVVVLMDILEAGKKDLEEWLRDLPPSGLDKHQAFPIDEGQSALIPFGKVPIVIAMPSGDSLMPAATKEKTAGKKATALTITNPCVTYTSIPIMDAVDDVSAGAQYCQHIAAEYVNSSNALPASYRRDVHVEWRKALETAAKPVRARGIGEDL